MLRPSLPDERPSFNQAADVLMAPKLVSSVMCLTPRGRSEDRDGDRTADVAADPRPIGRLRRGVPSNFTGRWDAARSAFRQRGLDTPRASSVRVSATGTEQPRSNSSQTDIVDSLPSISMSSIMQTFSSLTKGLSWNQYPTESTTTNVQTPAPCGTTSEVTSVTVAEANDAEPDWLREAGNRVLETSARATLPARPP